jgi:WD40 repeat protein
MLARTLVRCLCALLAIGWSGAVVAQELRFRLPDDDPNENSDVIRSAAFSPDGTLLAVGYGRFIGLLQEPRPGQAILWDTRSGRRKTTIKAKIDGVCAVAFSPDGKTLAVAEYPGLIRLWDVGADRERLALHTPSVLGGGIAFSPDGRQFAAGIWPGSVEGVANPDAAIVVWDTAAGELMRTLKGHVGIVGEIAFSPDGKTLASGGFEDGLVKLWRFADEQIQVTTLAAPIMYTLPFKKPFETPLGIKSLAFSPDGNTLAVAAGLFFAVPRKPDGIAEVTLWSLKGERKLATLEGHPASVDQVAFSVDGKLLATACRDGRIRLWDCGDHREVGTLEGRSPLAFSPDGQSLALRVEERTMTLRKLADLLHP